MRILIIIFLLLLSGCTTPNSKTVDDFRAESGILDLSPLAFNENTRATLNGEWEFYWNEFLSPEELILSKPPSYIELPNLWNDFEYENSLLSGHGYATFHLTVKINKEDIGKNMGLYIPYLHTAYNVYIDGEQKGTVGKIGTNQEDMRPQYLTKIIFFTPANENIDIVFHVANFHHTKGGFVHEIQLGKAETIASFKEKRVANNLFLFGSFFIISIYHMAIFLYRRVEVSSLAFSLFSFVIAIRMLLIDQVFLITLFPEFNWSIAMKLEYLANYGGFVLFLIFLKTIYPKEVNKTIYQILLGVTSAYSLIMIITTPNVFTSLFKNFTFVALTSLTYFGYILIIAAIRKREGSIISCISGVFFFLTAAHDFLFSYGAIQAKGYIMPAGFFVFLYSQSLVLSIKYAKTYKQVAKLNTQLQELNESLEDEVQKRTETLKRTMKETATAIAEKSMLEERSRLVREIHDTVGHTLTSIIVQIEAGKRLIHKDIDSSLQRLNASQNMGRSGLDEIRRLLRVLKTDDIKKGFIDSIEKLIEDTKYSNIMIDEMIDIKSKLSSVQQHVLFRALQEGITNGIRHGNAKKFTFHLYETEHEVVFYLTDNGKGAEHIQYGIGLSSMLERVNELNGKMEVKSTLGAGFTIMITLPIGEDNKA